MLRWLIALSVVFPGATYSQERYSCEYRDAMSFPMPDSVLSKLRGQLEERALPSKFIEQFLVQFKNQGLKSTVRRFVDADPDSIFIVLITSEDDESNAKMNMPDQYLLLINNEIYKFDSTEMKYSLADYVEPLRTFVKNGETRMIMGYSCIGYSSTDSSGKIWVAPSLPSYIDPGIRKGSIEGAVLGFELRQKYGIVVSVVEKIERREPQAK